MSFWHSEALAVARSTRIELQQHDLSTLCFRKEDQPTSQFVALVIGVRVLLHEAKKSSVVINCQVRVE